MAEHEIKVDTGVGGVQSLKIDLPSNSISQKEEKKVEPIAHANTTKKKPGIGRKVLDMFTRESVRDVGEYVVTDVIVPSIIKMVVTIIKNSTDLIFTGKVSGDKRKDDTYISYSERYKDGDSYPYRSSRRNSRYDFTEITFDSRGEAEDVLDQMLDIIDRYRSVSVADFYSLSDVRHEYTDEKYGWFSLRSASIKRGYGGWYVDLPRPEVI